MLDEILPEAFATVREAARRLLGTTVSVTGQRARVEHGAYDVQLMGGIQLHLGKIAEMATGEGKTLVATLPLYLNALPGKGAHLVTVNSYLARRDSQWMGHLYTLPRPHRRLPRRHRAGHAGAPRGVPVATSRTARTTSSASTTCATTWWSSLEQRVQRSHVYAIVDEVDSVLIDEARTPLIISGPVGNESDAEYCEHNAGGRAARAAADGARERARRRGRARARGGRHGRRRRSSSTRRSSARPKNKRLLKVLQEPGVKQLVQKMELEHIADRKLPAVKQQFRDIEDDLLFVLDEKGHTVHLTDRGVDFMSPHGSRRVRAADISQRGAPHRPRSRADAARRSSRRARRSSVEYAAKSERLNIVHQLLRAHALYEKDVNYVVQEGRC